MDGTKRNIARVVVQMLRDTAKTKEAKKKLDDWYYGKNTTIKDLENIGKSLEGVDAEAIQASVDRFREVGGYE